MSKVLIRASIEVGGVDLSDHCSQVEVGDTTDEVDATGMSTSYDLFLPGLRDGSITATFWQDFGHDSVDDVLYWLRHADTPFSALFKPTSDPISTVNPGYTMVAILTTDSPVSGGAGEGSEIVATFRNAGPFGIVRTTDIGGFTFTAPSGNYGNYRLSVNPQSSLVDIDASAAEFTSALQEIIAGGVTVTGPDGGPYDVTLQTSGTPPTVTAADVAVFDVDVAYAADTKQIIRVPQGKVGGSFTLTMPASFSAPPHTFSYDPGLEPTTNDLAVKLASGTGVELQDLVVLGDDGGPWLVIFDGQFAGTDPGAIGEDYSGLWDSKQQTLGRGPATGGTFTVTFNGQTTANVAYNASASTLQSALEGLSNINPGDIVVTGAAGGPWALTWAGQYTGVPHLPNMTVDGTNLTGGPDPNLNFSKYTINTDYAVGSSLDVIPIVSTLADSFGSTPVSRQSDHTLLITASGWYHVLTCQEWADTQESTGSARRQTTIQLLPIAGGVSTIAGCKKGRKSGRAMGSGDTGPIHLDTGDVIQWVANGNVTTKTLKATSATFITVELIELD